MNLTLFNYVPIVCFDKSILFVISQFKSETQILRRIQSRCTLVVNVDAKCCAVVYVVCHWSVHTLSRDVVGGVSLACGCDCIIN